MMERFWNKVDTSGDCWLWLGARTNGGYPRFRWDGKTGLAHRFVLMLVGREVPKGYEVDHLCRVPLCVNPDHLEAVTKAENMRRKSVATTHCKWGHPFDFTNTWVDVDGHRLCRVCHRDRQRARRAA